jgi:hypothetical protein
VGRERIERRLPQPFRRADPAIRRIGGGNGPRRRLGVERGQLLTQEGKGLGIGRVEARTRHLRDKRVDRNALPPDPHDQRIERDTAGGGRRPQATGQPKLVVQRPQLEPGPLEAAKRLDGLGGLRCGRGRYEGNADEAEKGPDP